MAGVATSKNVCTSDVVLNPYSVAQQSIQSQDCSYKAGLGVKLRQLARFEVVEQTFGLNVDVLFVTLYSIDRTGASAKCKIQGQ